MDTPLIDETSPGQTGMDDEDYSQENESENEEVSSSPETTEAPAPAKPRGAARKPAQKPPAKPTAPARSKTPPPAAKGKAAAPARSKSPPPAARTKAERATPEQARAYRDSAELLRLIADPTRLAIVDHLRNGALNVTEICEKLGIMTQPAVSHHLALLRHGRIVEPNRQGKNNYYSLTSEHGQLLADVVEDMTAA